MDQEPPGRQRRRLLVAPISASVLSILAAFALVSTASAPSASANPASPGARSGGASKHVVVGSISNVSASCSGQNAEVEQAIDPSGSGDVYEAWLGCGGIGFALSTNKGATFSSPVRLPVSDDTADDPTVAVSPTGTVFVAFMVTVGGQSYPVVDASSDHGATFPQVTSLIPPDPQNFGDSDNIAVGPDGTLYVTWDYGPSNNSVVLLCSRRGSCSFSSGELNVVIQKSTDDGKTFTSMVPVSPGYPAGGADNAPLVVVSGRIDVLFQAYPTNPTTLALSPAVNYFTSSGDGGATWSQPVAVGPGVGRMSLAEWWNEPSLGVDAAGNLYAAWDTQATTIDHIRSDTGWLSYSSDGGAVWSTPVQTPLEQRNFPHIMEVTGGAAGEAYVGWLTDSGMPGYSLYLRPFSIAGGWLTKPIRLAKLYGNRTVWPGDTFGLSTLDSNHIVTSWGSAATNHKDSSIYAAEETIVGLAGHTHGHVQRTAGSGR